MQDHSRTHPEVENNKIVGKEAGRNDNNKIKGKKKNEERKIDCKKESRKENRL